MNFILTRKEFRSDGIFGEMVDENSDNFFYILEHAFVQSDGSFLPKVAAGVYTCIRGTHALHDGIPFITFELQDVPPFMGNPVTGILIHQGNYSRDSFGCLLIGLSQGRMSDGGKMICSSKQALQKFLNLETGDSFTLTIQ